MSTMHTFQLVSGKAYTFETRHRRAGAFLKNLAEAQRVESGTLAQVAALQEGLLHDLLDYVCKYSRVWASRLDGCDTWDLVPILDRNTLLAQLSLEGPLLEGLGRDRFKKASTSGSTGHAVEFYRTGRAAFMNRLRYTLDHLEQGRDLSKKMALTKYNARAKEAGKWLWPPDFAKYLQTGPSCVVNHIKLPTEELARWLQQAAPAYLFTTAPVLDLLTEVWRARPELIPRLEQVATFSFNVPAETRANVRELTGARIADRYSSEEVGPIAFQCPLREDRYHVATSNVILEIVNHQGQPAAPDELGRVLVTALHNYATPFLRYELGDLAAVRAGCECGHRGPVITQLAGRARSLLYLGPGQYKNFTIRARDWTGAAPVREYRVLQTALGRLEAEVTADRALDEEALQRLRGLIAGNAPADFSVEVRQVKAIDWGPGYKRLEFRCLV